MSLVVQVATPSTGAKVRFVITPEGVGCRVPTCCAHDHAGWQGDLAQHQGCAVRQEGEGREEGGAAQHRGACGMTSVLAGRSSVQGVTAPSSWVVVQAKTRAQMQATLPDTKVGANPLQGRAARLSVLLPCLCPRRWTRRGPGITQTPPRCVEQCACRKEHLQGVTVLSSWGRAGRDCGPGAGDAARHRGAFGGA